MFINYEHGVLRRCASLFVCLLVCFFLSYTYRLKILFTFSCQIFHTGCVFCEVCDVTVL